MKTDTIDKLDLDRNGKDMQCTDKEVPASVMIVEDVDNNEFKSILGPDEKDKTLHLIDCDTADDCIKGNSNSVNSFSEIEGNEEPEMINIIEQNECHMEKGYTNVNSDSKEEMKNSALMNGNESDEKENLLDNNETPINDMLNGSLEESSDKLNEYTKDSGGDTDTPVSGLVNGFIYCEANNKDDNILEPLNKKSKPLNDEAKELTKYIDLGTENLEKDTESKTDNLQTDVKDDIILKPVENEVAAAKSIEKECNDSSSTTNNAAEVKSAETAPIVSGQKRAIEETEGDARQALKKIRIFDNSSKRQTLQDSKLKNSDAKNNIGETNILSKLLKDEKSKDSEVIKKMNQAAEVMNHVADKEPVKPRLKSISDQKLRRISRKDLENIAVQLFADRLLYEHELGQKRDLCKRLQTTLEANRKKTAQFHKEIDDLKKVTQRLQAEYSARKGQIVTPVKVKRSVGIHVTPTIISRGVTSSESVLHNVKYISPSKHRRPENMQKNEQKSKKASVTLSEPLKLPAPKTKTAAVSNTIHTVKVPVGQVATSTNVSNGHANVKSGLIDLTDDGEANKNLVTPTFAGGTSMVAIPRQAINLTSPGQFLALPQSSVNSLLLVPPSAATLVVTSMANSLHKVGGVSTAIRAPIISSPIGINVSQGASTATRLILTPAIKSSTISPQTSQFRHPAALPKAPSQQTAGFSKKLPPQPILNLSHKDNTGIVLLWKMAKTDEHEAIASYQLYAYQEGSAPPLSSLWKKVGSVKALELPMACTLTQFMSGHTYHFAVRAVDIRNRLGPFSDPKSIKLKK